MVPHGTLLQWNPGRATQKRMACGVVQSGRCVSPLWLYYRLGEFP